MEATCFGFMLCNPKTWQASRAVEVIYISFSYLAKLSYAQFCSIVCNVKLHLLYLCQSEAATMRVAATSFSPLHRSNEVGVVAYVHGHIH